MFFCHTSIDVRPLMLRWVPMKPSCSVSKLICHQACAIISFVHTTQEITHVISFGECARAVKYKQRDKLTPFGELGTHSTHDWLGLVYFTLFIYIFSYIFLHFVLPRIETPTDTIFIASLSQSCVRYYMTKLEDNRF